MAVRSPIVQAAGIAGLAMLAGSAALARPQPALNSPWHSSNWLSCTANRCSGIRPDGTEVLLQRSGDRLSPTQATTAVLGGITLTTTTERGPITTAGFALPVLTVPPTQRTEGTVFGTRLSLFTTSAGVMSGTFGGEPVSCAAVGWGTPTSPDCF